MASAQRSKPLDIAVVGAGIAGLTLVIGLLKQNLRVTLYESARNFGEIGAGVAFGPNATRAMSLIDPAVRNGFENVATSNQWESKRHVWFDFRYGQDEESKGQTGKLMHTLSCPDGQATAHRAKLLEELVKLVPDTIVQFGKRLVGLEEMGGEGVRLIFRDGSEATHAAVVSCDGIKSETRKYVLGRDHPASFATFSGKYCYRGLIPMDKAAEVLGDELAMNNNVYLGHHGHILTFPVEKGKTMNVVAFSSRDTWDSDAWVVPTTHAEMLDAYADWGKTVHKILALMEKADIWALFDHADTPAPTYYKGRVCIMGDAAHASTPHQGSGAGMAIEDAYVMSNLLEEVEDSEQFESAFRAFDAVRRARTQKLVATSREASHLWEFELEGVGADIDKIKDNIDGRMHWIWNEDLKAEVEKGRSVMRI